MRKMRIAAALFGGLLLAAGLLACWLYWASQRVPGFYREAMASDPAAQKKASDALLRQATALASDAQKRGPWKAVFSAEQINGWLAVDLVENHADLLPPELSDPRVEITPEHVTIACRYRDGNLSAVFSLTAEPYLTKPNVVSLRIRKARAGAVPIPLGKILDAISQAARQMNARLEWRQADGDPVAVISIPTPRDRNEKQLTVQVVELRQGEVYLSGQVKK
jgi:hypothetical protein